MGHVPDPRWRCPVGVFCQKNPFPFKYVLHFALLEVGQSEHSHLFPGSSHLIYRERSKLAETRSQILI